MSWLNGPLAAFDLETTGTDTESDRIVTACVGVAPKPGAWGPWTTLINPGVDIPEGATAVHGITNEAARRSGIDPAEGVASIVSHLNDAWATGAPVIGHNVVYDLTLLDRECRRHLGQPLTISGPVIDTLVLDKEFDTYRKGRRTLTAICEHYGVPIEDAHNAAADAFAALRLAYRILQGWDQHDLPQLFADQAVWYRRQRESFNDYLRRKGETPDNENGDWPIAGAA